MGLLLQGVRMAVTTLRNMYVVAPKTRSEGRRQEFRDKKKKMAVLHRLPFHPGEKCLPEFISRVPFSGQNWVLCSPLEQSLAKKA